MPTYPTSVFVCVCLSLSLVLVLIGNPGAHWGWKTVALMLLTRDLIVVSIPLPGSSTGPCVTNGLFKV